ncbi:hypothetical protein BJX70DRAFT_401067 [Aspergillus crustosus]
MKQASVECLLLHSVQLSLAFFKVPCSTPLVIQRADPIVQPGVASGHVNTIMGGSGFGFTMDYNMTQTSQCNSCSAVEDKSNYWVDAADRLRILRELTEAWGEGLAVQSEAAFGMDCEAVLN